LQPILESEIPADSETLQAFSGNGRISLSRAGMLSGSFSMTPFKNHLTDRSIYEFAAYIGAV
jgi:hypothetical protein